MTSRDAFSAEADLAVAVRHGGPVRIAYLEDEADQAATVRQWLQAAGCAVDWFTQGLACALAVDRGAYDLLLLDWMVPDLTGADVLLRARGRLGEHCPPIIVLSGRDSDQDVADLLRAGADDYVVKPASRAVLLARIEVCLRRTQPPGTPPLEHGRIRVDFERRRVLLDGTAAALSAKETGLALYLFARCGRLLPRAQIANAVWGLPPDVDTRTIDVHVSSLRRKLALHPAEGWRLTSVYGQGYRLERLNPPRNRADA